MIKFLYFLFYNYKYNSFNQIAENLSIKMILNMTIFESI